MTIGGEVPRRAGSVRHDDGQKEHDTRLRADIGRYITAGGYRMWLNDPFPQASGIVAVEGPGEYQGRGDNRWGLVLLAHLP